MELTFRAATPAERLYIARQSTQIEGQTGSIGHLRADMGEDGKGFFPKWTSHRENLDTEEFQQEFEEVLEALVGDEQYDGFLKSRDAMRDFCRGHQESGYYRTDKYGHDRAEALEVASECNERGGVTKAQTAAMLSGSLFGWEVPAADPKNYDEQGQPIKPKRHDRGNAR